jgi:hypothetical protein
MDFPEQVAPSRSRADPIYKYVKEITDDDIDALDDPYQLNDALKLSTKEIKLNDKINIVNHNILNNMFGFTKVGYDKTFLLPKIFLNTNFKKLSNDDTTQSRRTALGKEKRKTRRTKSKNKRRMTMRKKRRGKK